MLLLPISLLIFGLAFDSIHTPTNSIHEKAVAKGLDVVNSIKMPKQCLVSILCIIPTIGAIHVYKHVDVYVFLSLTRSPCVCVRAVSRILWNVRNNSALKIFISQIKSSPKMLEILFTFRYFALRSTLPIYKYMCVYEVYFFSSLAIATVQSQQARYRINSFLSEVDT